MLNKLSARWKSLWNHDMYHGWNANSQYFEGWYFKIVSHDQKHALAFIPGISIESRTKSHAFIQVMDGVNATSQYITFPASEFQPSESNFDTHLGANRFHLNGMELSLEHISGTIEFEDVHPWPTQWIAPGIMGWYSFVPFMQCYHGVVSTHHKLKGSLTIDSQEVDFTGGIGYIEKDWGTSFPKTWIWMQTNHFEGDQAPDYFMASVAHIPWLGRHFIGFLSGLYIDGKLHIFTTYNKSSYEANVEGNDIYLIFKRKNIVIKVHGKKKKGAELISPTQGSMTGKLEESIQSEIFICVTQSGKVIYEGLGTSAGLEVGGPYEELLTDSFNQEQFLS